ncbi:GNAT family N-acetyltransferase, partial [Stutzerimonas kunmingensis]|uniref:GNAT family N-acetyltransferase n=1 Tax=Stutzerimonas kunmingensis TaxID=1211807 RepID=UPI003119F216
MTVLSDLQTKRLLLRQWTPADRAPFARMNADPRVMQHFPALLSRVDSDAMADRCQALIED